MRIEYEKRIGKKKMRKTCSSTKHIFKTSFFSYLYLSDPCKNNYVFLVEFAIIIDVPFV